MQIFVLKSPGIEIILYFKGFGFNPAFLLDIKVRYSYIQSTQKQGFINYCWVLPQRFFLEKL